MANTAWPVRNLILALAYYLTGLAGLLLTSPPDYATAIWPPAGIALAAALMYGPRILPGVVLGAFVINVETLARNQGATVWQVSWVMPLLIALGAAAQAWAGAALARRFGGFPTAFEETAGVLRTLALGGLVATLINASWGMFLLYGSHAMTDGRIVQNALVWWVGDSLGVLLFTPLVLVWASREPHYARRRAVMVTLVLLATSSLATVGFRLVGHVAATERINRFQAAAERAVRQLENRFADYETFAYLFCGLFYSQHDVTPEQFDRFVQEWIRRHPEVKAVEWAPLVSAADRAATESRLTRLQGRPVRIFRRGPQQELRESPAGAEYLPLLYVSPFAANRTVLGLDIASEPDRMPTLRAAAELGVPVISPPITLIQDLRGRPAVILLTPVYREGAPRHGWENLRGFMVMVLRMDEVIARLTRDTLPGEYALVLTDRATGKTLFGTPPETALKVQARRIGLAYRREAVMAQRRWLAEVWPTNPYISGLRSWETWLVFVIGLVGTGLSVSFALINSGRREQLKRTVAERTAELRQRNAELDSERARVVDANRALVAARIEAERANQSKSDFLASMSHEFRTPMNAILGFTYLLLNTRLGAPQAREYLKNIEGSAQSLLRLVNDILDFSKIEAGHLELSQEVFRPDDVVNRAVGQVRLAANAKGLTLRVEVAPDVPARVTGDPVRLGQVVLNLLDNAVKFTTSGQVTVTMRVDEPDSDAAKLAIEIRDTGIGIAPAVLPTLFEPFTQGDSSITRRYGGTGLGLSICKRLMTLMEGDIRVDSTPDVGSVFCVSLPLRPALAAPDSPDVVPAAIPRFAPARVLLVEDNRANQWLTSEMLRRMGLTVEAASDGREGLRCLEDATEPFALVLMDLQMPVMDGFEACLMLRSRYDAHTLPVVAMTGLTLPDERKRCFEVGMNAHLAKPVSLQELAAMLARFLTVADPVAAE